MLTGGEKRFCDYKADRSGSFFTHLFDAIFAADPDNQASLARGFPQEVLAVQRFQNDIGGTYWERLQKEYSGQNAQQEGESHGNREST
jgi:hypothetical protein